jgi:2-keto-4-pentenoate hydratase/2-oxohepta-3-ene-1,7-dioic acid hydratase in catechol pathway
VKLALFQKDADVLPGVINERGVVSIADLVKLAATPQLTMNGIIDDFERLRPSLERRAAEGDATPLENVRLRAPLPRPGKILACIANYWEHGALAARPLNMFLKNPDAVIGPGDTIVLPEFAEPWIFMHEAELALVIRGPAKMVKAKDWESAVFGYTGMIDVSARGDGRRTWKTGSWLGKSFDTFAPLGPYIATRDEIPNPNDVLVRFWVDGQLRHNYNNDHDAQLRRRDLVRHEPRRSRTAAGWRSRRLRDPQHRPHAPECARPAEAVVGKRYLHGRRFDQPGSGEAQPAA